jgi:hypothetical protein
MITIRIKSVNETTNQANYMTTRINLTFKECIKKYLHDGKYWVDYDLYKDIQYSCMNVSIELLEG